MKFVIDVETHGLAPWDKDAYLVQIGVLDELGLYTSYLFNHPENKLPFRDSIDELKERLQDMTVLINHNLKFDLHWLRSIGFVFDCNLFDTMVAQYLLSGQTQSMPSLDTCCEIYNITGKIKEHSLELKEKKFADLLSAEHLIEYNKQDCLCTWELYQKQREIIIANKLVPLYALHMEMVGILADMEWNGLKVKPDLMKQYSEEYGKQIAEKEERLQALLGSDLNLDSKDHLSAALFGGIYKYKVRERYERRLKDGTIKEKEHWTEIVKTHPGMGFIPQPEMAIKKVGYYQTNKDALASLHAKTKEQREVLSLISELADLKKQKSTYFDGLQEHIAEGDTIHANLNQCITKTQRLSSSNPNDQNIPRASTSPVKRIFTTRYEDNADE